MRELAEATRSLSEGLRSTIAKIKDRRVGDDCLGALMLRMVNVPAITSVSDEDLQMLGIGPPVPGVRRTRSHSSPPKRLRRKRPSWAQSIRRPPNAARD
jgi:hypothetical protein